MIPRRWGDDMGTGREVQSESTELWIKCTPCWLTVESETVGPETHQHGRGVAKRAAGVSLEVLSVKVSQPGVYAQTKGKLRY